MGQKKLGYDYLEKNCLPPKAVNGFIMVEVIAKTSTKISASGIVYAVNEQAERTPYFIVREVSDLAKEKLSIKPGDVIGSASRDLVSWVDGNGDRFATIYYDQVSVIFSKLNSDPEEYVYITEPDLSGSSSKEEG